MNGRSEGRVEIVIRGRDGATLHRRRAENVVLQSGAGLVAALFAGRAATPVNGVAVGVSPVPSGPPYDATALTTTTADGTVIVQQAAAAIDPAVIVTEILAEQLKVRVSFRSVIGPGRAVSPDATVRTVHIGEAAIGVLAADGNSLVTTYNRVVFEPVPKARDQELALYWEIDFPYGV